MIRTNHTKPSTRKNERTNERKNGWKVVAIRDHPIREIRFPYFICGYSLTRMISKQNSQWMRLFNYLYFPFQSNKINIIIKMKMINFFSSHPPFFIRLSISNDRGNAHYNLINIIHIININNINTTTLRTGGGSMLGDVNISAILDSFSVSYDKRVRPNYGGT